MIDTLYKHKISFIIKFTQLTQQIYKYNGIKTYPNGV